MRYLTALLLLSLTGCRAGTYVKVDPETKSFEFERPWLGGPVEFEGTLDTPDGTHATVKWKSDVDLDPAAASTLGWQSVVVKALEKVPVPAGGVP